MHLIEQLAQPIGNAKIGRVLAKRYKVLGTIGAGSFKAHDLALDQTVTVRQAMLTGERDGDTWRQKLQQLASLRDPNFLNVLDVVADKSGEFVITERPRGQSIAELHKERSRLDLEDVLWLMTPLVGALDFAAALASRPNPISICWLFTEPRRSCAVDSGPPFFIRLDIWEFVRPRRNIAWPSFTSKAQRGDRKQLAVRQAALLTYELLCGEHIKKSGVQRWYRPVRQLSDPANWVLYDGLQGSPLFENSGCFFHRLESANRCGDGSFKALPTREYSCALRGTDEVIRGFNRNTQRLAMCVLGAVVFAILMLAVMIRERDPNAAKLREKETRARGDLLVDANPANLSKVVGLDGKNSTGEITSEQTITINQESTVVWPPENFSALNETSSAAQNPVVALTHEINQPDLQSDARPRSWAHRHDSARVMRSKMDNIRHRSSVRFRFVDAKMRLIALWHQSLARSEASRSWRAFSNLNKGQRKKVTYTVERLMHAQ